MAELKERLLPPKPQSAINLRDAAYRSSAPGRQPFQGMDVLGLKKRGQGLRSWIRVDASGNSQVIEVDKFTMMRRCDLPARDLRLLDPLFVYPSTILGREKAIVINLEQIRCIITADEVLLLNSLDSYVLQYVVELQRRLTTSGVGEVWQSDAADLSLRRGIRSFDNVFGSTSPDYLPFEFRALEVALEAACTFLDSQANRFEQSQMNFLWDVLEDEFKYPLVAWDIVCSSIEILARLMVWTTICTLISLLAQLSEALRSLTVNSFLDLIYSKVPGAEGGDRLQWHLNWSGKLDVCSFYKAVREGVSGAACVVIVGKWLAICCFIARLLVLRGVNFLRSSVVCPSWKCLHENFDDDTCVQVAAELEIEAYPLLDELTSKISTLNLERARRLKSRLVALTRRVQKVRDEIEQLMDDDGDMAEMYLTEKKKRMETSFYGDQSVMGYRSTDGASISAPVSPVSSPPEARKLEKSLSIARSRHESMRSSESGTESIEELEMLLEAYFVVIDSTLNKLTSLKEYIDDTEDFINIQLDNVRNQLIQFELLLTTATFVVAIFGVVAGIFGMNFSIPLFDDPGAFKWVLTITGVTGAIIFSAFVWFFKYRRLMPL
uniref:Magnesium transporter n=1 Tax=Quercus lobata TaxID=97700 RepID=A0A7N2LPM1_QUELO